MMQRWPDNLQLLGAIKTEMASPKYGARTELMEI